MILFDEHFIYIDLSSLNNAKFAIFFTFFIHLCMTFPKIFYTDYQKFSTFIVHMSSYLFCSNYSLLASTSQLTD